MKWSEPLFKPSPRALRQFAAAWLVFFLALASHQLLVRHHLAAGCALGLIALIGLIGLLKPALIRWVFVSVTLAAFPIGWLMTQLILAVMFYLVLTPIALVFRRRGRDELQLRHQPERASFWITRASPPAVERYLKPF